MTDESPETDPLARTDRDPDLPRLALSRGVEYRRMRGLIESSLFGDPVEPLRIGRFTVLERLGAGGMGVVYSAYDDVLDRKVAVKMLHGTADERARERMLREARAMARLTHPNIVAIHEVGEHDGRVFLAMEFVRGRSLDRWIHAEPSPPPWGEVLEVFRQAGRGLAAAHRAGLVHRDFKPHNVILGDDGMVKVLDFGLAWAAEPGEDSPALDSGSPDELPDDEPEQVRLLTRTGAVVGTPAYMAPEQFRAKGVTAASDQFSFCVSLHEALFGLRPFAGDRLPQLMMSVLEGRVEEAPAGSPVPAWVRAVVRRGLSLEPEERFPSMEALLDALARNPAAVRRRWLGVGAAVTLAVAGSFGLAALQREEPAQPCQSIDRALDPIWGPSGRDAVHEGLLASGVGYADDTWSRLEPRLDAYAREWVEVSTDACLAHEGGRQSTTIFDLRTSCLESRRASLEAVTQRLRQADEGIVARAADMVAGLPGLARCSDLEALTAAVPPPEDPAQAEEVAELREQLVVARVEEDAGRYDVAERLAEQTLRRAGTLAYDPLRAEATLRLGSAQVEQARPEESDASLTEAFFLALGAGHDEVALEALARRIYERTELQGRAERALDDEPLARALSRRVPGDARLRWLLANNLGVAHERTGDTTEAARLYGEALEHARARGDAGRLEASAVFANLAYMAEERQDEVAAETEARSALALAEQELGPEHPRITAYLFPLSLSLVGQGRLEDARAVLERSVAIHEQRSGGPSPDIAQDLYLLAHIAKVRRRYERMDALVIRALDLVTTQLGPKTPYAVRLLHAHGDARLGRGARDEGLALHRQARALAQTLFGSEHLGVADSGMALSEALELAGEIERARAEAQEALALATRTHDDDAPALVPFLQRVGEVELAAGSPQAATVVLERALSIMTQRGAAAASVAPVRARLAEARLAHGAVPRARDGYAKAVQEYETTFDDDHPELARARAGLARALRHCIEDATGCTSTEDVPATIERALELSAAAVESYAALGEGFEAEARALAKWREELGRLR